MNQYHSVNMNLSKSQLSKLKSTTKIVTGVNLRLSWNMIGTNKTDASHNLLLSDRHVLSLPNVLPNK